MEELIVEVVSRVGRVEFDSYPDSGSRIMTVDVKIGYYGFRHAISPTQKLNDICIGLAAKVRKDRFDAAVMASRDQCPGGPDCRCCCAGCDCGCRDQCPRFRGVIRSQIAVDLRNSPSASSTPRVNDMIDLAKSYGEILGKK